MTRMSKEFTLVLLGAGVLTAGYFAIPSAEEEMEAKAEDQAAERTGHGTSHHSSGYHSGRGLIWLHSPGYSGTGTGRPAAYSATTRTGGFGGVGRAFSGGS